MGHQPGPRRELRCRTPQCSTQDNMSQGCHIDRKLANQFLVRHLPEDEVLCVRVINPAACRFSVERAYKPRLVMVCSGMLPAGKLAFFVSHRALPSESMMAYGRRSYIPGRRDGVYPRLGNRRGGHDGRHSRESTVPGPWDSVREGRRRDVGGNSQCKTEMG